VELLPHLGQQLLHQRAGLGVQRTERLVEEEDIGVVGQGSRDGDALLHAPRERLGIRALEAPQADFIDEFPRGVLSLDLGRAGQLQAELDVLRDREPWEERVALKHHASVRSGTGDCPAVQVDRPARRSDESGDDTQQCGLAAAGRTQDGRELLVADCHGHVIDRGDLVATRPVLL